jgi:hypothetical protein
MVSPTTLLRKVLGKIPWMMSFEHEGVSSMDPIADGPVTAGRATDPGMAPSVRVDPVRVVVHAMLAIYLMPVILIVCLIGTTSMLAGRTTRIVVDKLGRKGGSRPIGLACLDEEKNGPRLIYRRQRSRSTR